LLEKSDCAHKRHHQVVDSDEKETTCYIVPVWSISSVDFEEYCQNEQTNYNTLPDSCFTSLWISHNTTVRTPNQVFKLRHHWRLFVVVYVELGVLEYLLFFFSYTSEMLIVVVCKELNFLNFFGIFRIVNCKFCDIKIGRIVSRRARDSYLRKVTSAL
jgi:hypothetical protein